MSANRPTQPGTYWIKLGNHEYRVRVNMYDGVLCALPPYMSTPVPVVDLRGTWIKVKD